MLSLRSMTMEFDHYEIVSTKTARLKGGFVLVCAGMEKSPQSIINTIVLLIVGVYVLANIGPLASLFSVLFLPSHNYYGSTLRGLTIPIPDDPAVMVKVKEIKGFHGDAYVGTSKPMPLPDGSTDIWTMELATGWGVDIEKSPSITWYIVPFTVSDSLEQVKNEELYLGLFSRRGNGKGTYHGALYMGENIYMGYLTPNVAGSPGPFFVGEEPDGTLVTAYTRKTDWSAKLFIYYRREGDELKLIDQASTTPPSNLGVPK